MSWDASVLPAFLLATAVFVLTPGVDVFLLLRTSVLAGTRAGLATLAGIHTAVTLHIVLVVSGVGLLVARNDTALTALRWLGAGYLAYLAVSILLGLVRRRTNPPGAEGDRTPEGTPPPATQTSRPYLRGLLTNLTNPKMLLFTLALLPQFMGSAQNSTLQLAVLGVVLLAVAVVLELCIVLAAGLLSERLRRPRVTAGLDAVCAGVFMVLSVGLVVG
ncbi:LysE family translocator [Actinoalloteichus sp. AHMU CJ021]|uniref:Threonine/homoserine/homoserine lactone efflux protein n=1 Tax=Actinoalloteichus caeruleus DSM 43889 TaxID=1120930 RepID=A0ABT1JPE5_ACTCY|nr:LysE family translocator [Actinoalloteichus caeruleus]AUS80167.1 LysE family translocator [Actinoalloteichus sp. AHMU CJ021]MCP2334392.1 Threonine/homoserine/homoserine lactone efflux protein [Actinoalloteichus caeruleus DSM 43889]